MKTQSIILTISLSAVLLGFTGCKKEDTTTSTDTSTPSTNTMTTEVKEAATNAMVGAENAGMAVKDATTNAVAEVKDKMAGTNATPPVTNAP